METQVFLIYFGHKITKNILHLFHMLFISTGYSLYQKSVVSTKNIDLANLTSHLYKSTKHTGLLKTILTGHYSNLTDTVIPQYYS